MDSAKKAAADRLRVCLDLFEAGVAMMRQTLRRRHPDASDGEIQKLFLEWMADRPGAEFGDAVGEPGTWPRKPR